MSLLGKSKREVLLEFRTSEILHAARAVFAARGFHAATIDEIAEAAGVAKGTVYLYFSSKRELFLATLREGIVELHAEVEREMEAALNTAGKIRGFLHGRLAYCDRNRDFFRIYYTEFASMQVRSNDETPAFQDLYDRQAEVLEAVLRKAIGDGDIRPCHVPRTARLIYDTARATIARHVLSGKPNQIEELTEELSEFIWRGIQC